jgi:hypothetical protein
MGTAIQLIDRRNGRPVEGVLVALENHGLNLFTAESDSKGYVVYDDVAPEGAVWDITGKVDDAQVYNPMPPIRVKEGELVKAPLIPIGAGAQGPAAGMGAQSRVIVIDDQTKQPIIGAQVSLVHADGSPFQNAVTDEEGAAYSDGAKSGMSWEGRTKYHYTGRVESTGNDVLVLRRVEGSSLPPEMLAPATVDPAAATGSAAGGAAKKFATQNNQTVPGSGSGGGASQGGGFPWIPVIALGGAAVAVGMAFLGGDEAEEEEE